MNTGVGNAVRVLEVRKGIKAQDRVLEGRPGAWCSVGGPGLSLSLPSLQPSGPASSCYF